MGTKTRGLAVALAALAVIVAAGCAKDETVTAASTTAPVTAKSSDGDSDTTEKTTPADEDEDADKDKGSGSFDDACAAIEEIDTTDFDADLDGAIDLMTEARDASPDELVDHWDKLIEVFEEIGSFEAETEEQIAATLELLEDEDFLEAAAAIDDFAEEECDLDIDLDPSEESDVPGGRTNDDEIGAPTEGDPTSIDSLQAHLEDTYGTEAWWPVLDDASGWYSTGSRDPLWTISLSSSSDWESLTTTELAAACDAIAEYLDTYEEGDVAVEIVDPDETILVSRYALGEPCTEG